MAGIDAKMLGLKVGNDFVTCEIGLTLNFQNEMLNCSSSVSGNWEYSRIGYKSWSASVDGKLVVSVLKGSFNSLFDAYLNDEQLTIMIQNRDADGQPFAIWGKALIQQGSLEAGNSGKAGWQIQFKGQGALSSEIELFWNIINAQPATADKPAIVDAR